MAELTGDLKTLADDFLANVREAFKEELSSVILRFSSIGLPVLIPEYLQYTRLGQFLHPDPTSAGAGRRIRPLPLSAATSPNPLHKFNPCAAVTDTVPGQRRRHHGVVMDARRRAVAIAAARQALDGIGGQFV